MLLAKGAVHYSFKPVHIAESTYSTRDYADWNAAVTNVSSYLAELVRARRSLDGHSVWYEDMVADPTKNFRALCEFLGVGWEPAMLRYGTRSHGRLIYGLGDFTEKIHTGQVCADRESSTAKVPAALQGFYAELGYLRGRGVLEAT